MRTLHASIITEKNKLDTPSAWLTLIELEINATTTVYYVPNPTNVSFDGKTYVAFGLRVTQVKSDLRAGLNETEIVVNNVTREISAFVEANDLRGRRVKLIGVHSAQLDDPTKKVFEEEYEINEIGVAQDVVTIKLGHERLLQQRFPGNRILRDNCRWVYNMPQGRSPECGYVDGFTGPGTVSSSGTTVTGTNTDFLNRFKAGDTITAASQARIVNVVSTNTSMTVTVAPSPVWSGATYTVSKPACDKILEGANGCRAHNNQTRIGAFPVVPFVGGRTALL